MEWFWYFVIYSFLGFLLEVVFAHLLHGRPDRKCFLVLPLCPVYGLGGCASVLLAPLAQGRPAALFLLCTVICSAVEYAMAVWYEHGVGVSFWDYTRMPGNLHGRVCLPFAAAWGLLALVLVYRVHPVMVGFVSQIPAAITVTAIPALLTDAVVSYRLLRRTGDRGCLRWYDGVLRKHASKQEA